MLGTRAISLIAVLKKLKVKEAYLEPCETSNIKFFVKIVNGLMPLTVFTKHHS